MSLMHALSMDVMPFIESCDSRTHDIAAMPVKRPQPVNFLFVFLEHTSVRTSPKGTHRGKVASFGRSTVYG
ncbi:hypothetical protein AB205_0221080 [Aquarana catesbeiana]|uniref:Uncharacterized protein n=1 Tax=Aquarana catesbeiana TaxID=8400 RepID=A0A2G9RJC9_AQUCT|nr:hypothetical protein AB205_0221080 [Aquarana catesbeiana]